MCKCKDNNEVTVGSIKKRILIKLDNINVESLNFAELDQFASVLSKVSTIQEMSFADAMTTLMPTPTPYFNTCCCSTETPALTEESESK